MTEAAGKGPQWSTIDREGHVEADSTPCLPISRRLLHKAPAADSRSENQFNSTMGAVNDGVIPPRTHPGCACTQSNSQRPWLTTWDSVVSVSQQNNSRHPFDSWWQRPSVIANWQWKRSYGLRYPAKLQYIALIDSTEEPKRRKCPRSRGVFPD